MSRIRALAFRRNELVRNAAFLTLWIALHVYAARPLLTLSPLAWIAVVVMPFVSLLPLFARRQSLAQHAGYASIAIFTSLLVVVLASDALRIVWAVVRFFVHEPALDPRRLALGAIVISILMFAVGLIEARRPRVVKLDVEIDDLPDHLDGYRIVQWSDVHVGPTIRNGFLRCLVDRTNALDADAIVITGDLIDGALDDLRDEVVPLRDLRARDGVFFVTGNHEYYWRASEWIPHLRRLGLTFLKNEHRVVRDRLVIAGVTDPAGRDTHETDPQRALAGAPRDAVKILLAHRPQIASTDADLQLSGHTHGGQFFPFNLLIRWFQPIVRGLHRDGRTQVYVSRGTGYWGPPSRLGVGGEITVLQLRPITRTS